MSTSPFSPRRRAGDPLFVSGQLSLGDAGRVSGGAAAETRQAIRNIAAVLAEHRVTLADVVQSTVFLALMADWPAMNKVYAELLGTQYPARSATGAELIASARVESEGVAYVPRQPDAR